VWCHTSLPEDGAGRSRGAGNQNKRRSNREAFMLGSFEIKGRSIEDIGLALMREA
jgi:hypothetical protein